MRDMEMEVLTAAEALRGVSDFGDRQRVAELGGRMMEILGAPHGQKGAAMRLVAAQTGLPKKTVERLYYAWRDGGLAALADGRKAVRGEGESIFYREFRAYAERDLNTDKGAYRAMLRDIRAGKAFAFGTWRDLWKRDFPFEAVPAACPSNWTPKGFSYANMMVLSKRDPARALSTAWCRQGQFAALKHVQSVVRSRVGLPVGAVYECDDVWHNVDVYMAGQKGVFNPLEFAIYDVSSAYKAVSVMKPRLLKTDPETGKETRDNLKEQQFRYALAYLATCVGVYREGATIIVERGTTAVRENVRRRIAAIPGWGTLLRFEVGGTKNEPAHKGLFMGNAGGNPRMKSLCECAHNIMHNATAQIGMGSHGRDAAHLHDSNAAMVKYTKRMLEQAERLDPALVPMLALPILDWRHYQAYFYAMEAEVMDRHDHHLEGWQERERLCYRLSETGDWEDAASLADKSPEEAAAIAAFLKGRPELTSMRKMSRREAWRAGQKDLVKFPKMEAPSFLDARDCREGTVRADGTVEFTDATYYPGETRRYEARYVDREGRTHWLAPGETVRFYMIPLGELADWIWIAGDDEERSVKGMSRALKTAYWTDEKSIKEAMGQQAHQIAALMGPTRARQTEDAARLGAKKAWNAALLAGAAGDGEAGTGAGDRGARAAGQERQKKRDDEPVSFEDLANIH